MKTLRTSSFCGSLFVNLRFDSSICRSLFFNRRFFVLDYPGCEELGGETHACGAVALTPNYSFAITLAGLNVREVQTGKLLWHSPGFAPRACVNPVLANGRVFWTSAASGVIYCWEP